MINVYLINIFLAVSTAIGMTLTPLIATDTLGISMFVLGMIEGGTEFLANALRVFSGNFFDRLNNKRIIFITPVSIALLSKICVLFLSAPSLLMAKALERIANGMFAAPRDAYIGVQAKNKGLALGILSCSKTLGCIIGTGLISLYAIYRSPVIDHLTEIIIIAIGISLCALFVSFFVKGPLNVEAKDGFSYREAREIITIIAPLLGMAALFFLGRFNDGVILLYLKSKNFPEWYYTSTIGIFNAAMFICSPVIGLLMDNKRTKLVLLITVIALLLFNIIYYFLPARNLILASMGLILWGIQRAGAQLVFTNMIFDIIPKGRYGTAIGIYSLVSGISVWISSSICGHLITIGGFEYSFIFSGCFNAVLILYILKQHYFK